MYTFILYVSVISVTYYLMKLLYAKKIIVNAGICKMRGEGELLKFVSIFIALFPVLFIIGNRNYVGTDYGNYFTMYQDYSAWGYQNDEWGIIGLFGLVNTLNFGYRGFLWITACISVLLSGVILCRNKNSEYASVTLFFYLLMYFGPACNIIAQIMSLSFIILSYEEILNKRVIRFLIYCVGAMLFHTASVIIVPLYWMINLNGKKRKHFIFGMIILISLLIASFPEIIVMILKQIGFANYAVYASHEMINTFIFMLIYRMPLYCIEVMNATKLIGMDNKYKFYYLLLVCEIGGMILGIGISWMGRVIYFFSIGHVIIDSAIIYSAGSKRNSLLYKYGFMYYYILAFFFMHFVSGFDGIEKFKIAF